MGRGRITEPEPEPELWKDRDFATADEGQPLTLLAGEQVVAPVWISPLYGLRAQEAPDTYVKK